MIFAALGWFSWMLSVPAICGLLLLGTIFEHNGARGWAVFTALATMAISYFVFNIPLLYIAAGAIGYIIIGLIWSFYRYKRHVSDVVEKAKTDRNPNAKEYAIRDLHPTAMLGSITAWILIWPFSLLENFIGDIINGIQTLVQKVFRSVYYRIYESAVSQLKK